MQEEFTKLKNREKGIVGERLAERYLKNNHYEILEKNYRCKMGEIDLIGWDKRKKQLTFVEVKARKNENYGTPAEAVDEKKRRHIRLVAQYYMHQKISREIEIRFDVIEIFLGRETWKLRHWRGVF